MSDLNLHGQGMLPAPPLMHHDRSMEESIIKHFKEKEG